MNWKKALRVVLVILYIALAAMSAAALAILYLKGMVVRSGGDVLAPVFTRENLARAFTPLLPLLAAAVILTVVCLAAGRPDGARSKARAPLRETPAPAREGRRTFVIRAVLLCAAAVLIVLGALNGGLRDVLVKAINLCKECVGLG